MLTAQRILLIAVPWIVLTQTGSPAATGLISAAQITPMLLAKVIGGPLLDRIGAARITVGGDQVCAAGMLLLAITGTAPLWLIATVMAATGAAEGLSALAKTALLPDAADTVHRPVYWATALMTTIERAATTVGPALGGLLIATIGGQRLLWLVAALFAGASLLARTNRPAKPPAPTAGPGYWRRLAAGAGFLRHDRSLRALAVMHILTNTTDQALVVILLPLWARTGGHGARLIAAAISTAAATAVLTALLATRVGHRIPRRSTYLVTAVLSGPTRFAVLAAGLPPATVLTVFAISRLGSGFLNPLVDTVQLERIPAALRGRVFALSTAAAGIGIPAGGIIGAALSAVTGLSGALWLCAAGYLAAVVYPGWRVAWDTPPGTNQVLPHPAGPR